MRVCLLLLFGFVGGCGSLSAPECRVVGGEIVESGADGAKIRVLVEASNPNEDSLPLKEVRYTVVVNDSFTFRGVRSAERTLGGGASALIELPVVLAGEIGANAAAGASLRVRGSVQYITPGPITEVLFDAGVLRPTTEFEAGELTLSAAGG